MWAWTLAVPLTGVAIQAQASVCDELVSESANYSLAYTLDIPTNQSVGDRTGYTVDNSNSIGEFDRVGYCMQLDDDWVWVSMDPFSTQVNELGVPDGVEFRQSLTGLSIESNVEGVATGGNTVDGRIEFWDRCYNRIASEGGDSATFDWDDTPWSGGPCYGSMQIHDMEARQTVFAYNGWTHVAVDDVGIGTNLSQANAIDGNINPDWTFNHNTGDYSVRRIDVYVREFSDVDGDGVADELDNCPQVANPNQDDLDGDAAGDICDICPDDAANDADGDGLCAPEDPCPDDAGNDEDGDGVCAAEDPCPLDEFDDSDGDGVCDSDDICPDDPNDDADGDGFCDGDEECPDDPDKQDAGSCGCGVPESYSAWATGQSYQVGSEVTYEGINYICRQAHTVADPGWNPAAAPALWERMAPCGTDAWTPGVGYSAGDVVSYGDDSYRCIQSHTAQVGWTPSAVPSLWARL